MKSPSHQTCLNRLWDSSPLQISCYLDVYLFCYSRISSRELPGCSWTGFYCRLLYALYFILSDAKRLLAILMLITHFCSRAQLHRLYRCNCNTNWNDNRNLILSWHQATSCRCISPLSNVSGSLFMGCTHIYGLHSACLDAENISFCSSLLSRLKFRALKGVLVIKDV